MNRGVENCDVSGGHYFMNSHNISEAKKHNNIDSTNKWDENSPEVSEIENTGLQDGVEIDVMLPASTIHKQTNIECNNDYQTPLDEC